MLRLILLGISEIISAEVNGIYLKINSLKLMKHLIVHNIIDATLEEALQIENYIKNI